MLQKNTIIDLWHALEDAPFIMRKDGEQVLDAVDGFMGFPWGTIKNDIWEWFEQNYKPWGGLRALLEDDPQPDRKFQVNTPAGIIEVYAKHEGTDSAEDYPGVYVDVRHTPEQLAGKEIGEAACVVEFCPECDANYKYNGDGYMQAVVYADSENEEPSFGDMWESGIVRLPWRSESKHESESTESSDSNVIADGKQLREAYELYKIRWMLNHRVTIEDVYKLVQEYIEEAKIASDFTEQPLDVIFGLHGVSISDDFNAYLEEHGFGGMIWPCMEEWLLSEENKNVLTYRAFMDEYADGMVYLDIYDENHEEIPAYVAISDDTVVTDFSIHGNACAITVHMAVNAAKTDGGSDDE